MASLRRTETAALETVFEVHRARLFAFLARLTGHRAQAEDLLQETFLRLARRAPSLAPETRLRPLLFTIARNLDRDRRRRALLDFDRLRELSLWPSERRREQDTPFDLAQASETQRRLEGALRTLPPKYREAVLLVCVEGFDSAQAADMLGVRPDALRQRLSRGRTLLKSALEDT